jgi:outer membrane protein assembly factor BamB
MRKPLRLWPGIAAGVVLVLRYIVPFAYPPATEISQIAGFACIAVIAVWWLFFSRARWFERIGAFAVMIAAVAIIRPFLHSSIVGGAMGALGYMLPWPAMCLALVVWAVGTRGWSNNIRWASMPVVILLGCASTALVRTDGIGGGALFQLQWRWTPSAEERLLAEVKDDPAPIAEPAAVEKPAEPAIVESEEKPSVTPVTPAVAATQPPPVRLAEWPGFRGPDRDGVVHGVRIDTNWSASPPMELWRRRIGPGWSSFAVDGDLFYTQEQRGDEEIVACYRVSTGEPVWRHRDAVRFYESNGGAGPRGTPTLSGGRVYSLGATGVLNALDARTGRLVWTRNAAADTKEDVPMWGFSGSPLVTGDVVIVATSATLAGYEITTGAPRWIGKSSGRVSYSSPHLLMIDGVQQAVLLDGNATSVALADGKVLWQHAWSGGAIAQPAVTADGDILINTLGATGGNGVRRLSVKHAAEKWTVEERWTSNGLKPYFNDFVVHKGHAYGFDGNILASIDLADGVRTWKGGRYGSGQLILVADQDLLLVLAEEGDLALVSATPDKFNEIARVPALDGKTWNHPVLVGDVLLVRNGEEMAAFRLRPATAGGF